MRLRSSPELSSKVPALSQDGLSSLSRILEKLEAATKETIVSSGSSLNLHALDNDIWVCRDGALRVYFSIAGDGDESYLLLLDISEKTEERQFRPFILRDPIKNPSVNPFKNTNLNPKFNTVLNPRFNTAINPNFNSTINPKFNASLNPRFNASINPRFNSTLNPRFNWAVNPQRNFSINPSRNHMFGGPFLYDLNLQRRGFVVRANEKARLVFDNDGKYEGLLVEASDKVSVFIDENSKFSGFFVNADNDVKIGFDENSNWDRFIV